VKHATFSHLTSSLPEISPVLLGVGVGRWATKSEGVGLIVRAISFQDDFHVILTFEKYW